MQWQEKERNLKEYLTKRIDSELRQFREAQKLAGTNCPGACMALGAMDACREILDFIESLE